MLLLCNIINTSKLSVQESCQCLTSRPHNDFAAENSTHPGHYMICILDNGLFIQSRRQQDRHSIASSVIVDRILRINICEKYMTKGR